MSAVITTGNETVMLGLKCDPRRCPKCTGVLVREVIDINLTESTCSNRECNYSARDRAGSVRDADDVRDAADDRHGRIEIRRRAG